MRELLRELLLAVSWVDCLETNKLLLSSLSNLSKVDSVDCLEISKLNNLFNNLFNLNKRDLDCSETKLNNNHLNKAIRLVKALGPPSERSLVPIVLVDTPRTKRPSLFPLNATFAKFPSHKTRCTFVVNLVYALLSSIGS